MFKHLSAIAAVVMLLATTCLAGIRAEGKYCGVVIFDRWGGCTLYSGVYVMYISEAVKEQLRPEAGKCVEIDATRVEQPKNPGDGLIRRFKLLGPAPAGRAWESPDGLTLTAARAFEDGNRPELVIRVGNVGDQPATVNMESLALTVLMALPNRRSPFGPSDGPSVAVITRQAFWNGGSEEARMQSGGVDQGTPYGWKVTAPDKREKVVSLQPKAVFEVRVSLELPAGEYEFLVGYGGGVHEGRCIASNRIGFDVREDGTAVLAKQDGR